MTLKSTLKTIKINENLISTVLGAIVIIIVGILVINLIKGQKPGNVPLPTGASTQQNQTESNSSTVVENGQKMHIVQSGDNLWKIAEAYYRSGYNWVDIAKANKLADPGVIVRGEKLIIPDVQAKTLTVKAESGQTLSQATESSISTATYTVVKGDSLWSISLRAYGDGYKWVDIAKANHLANPSIIHSGNILQIPR